MVNSAKLSNLVSSKQSIHKRSGNEGIIVEQVQTVKMTIEMILAIVTSKSGTDKDLEQNLITLSSFFRVQKFTTIILPVLERLATEDVDIWNGKKIGETQMPLLPTSFENMKASTIEVRDSQGTMIVPLERERELALLSIYGITMETLGEVFRILSKNSA